jgi:hypothetical protein
LIESAVRSSAMAAVGTSKERAQLRSARTRKTLE